MEPAIPPLLTRATTALRTPFGTTAYRRKARVGATECGYVKLIA
jgi:hypothetical protein